MESKHSQEKNCAESCAVHAGNGLQINEATNKKAVNCTVLQLTAIACEPQNGSGTRNGFDKPLSINELGNYKNPCAAKSVALLENPTLSPDDRQALETIISLWPELTPETKIGILKTIEAARMKTRVVEMR